VFEHAPLFLPTTFLLSIFNSRNIELLNGSAEVLVYYIQRWRNHFNSERAGDKFATSSLLKVHLCGSLRLHVPLHLHGALLLCGPVLGLSLTYGPFTSVTLPPGQGFVSSLRRLWLCVILVNLSIIYIVIRYRYYVLR